MDEAVKAFNHWIASKQQWRIKTIIPQKKKIFEDGMSFQVVLFPKKFDDFFKKRKVEKINLNGYLLFEESSLTVKQAEQLNLIMMRLKSKGVQRHLSTMVLIYLIGHYLSDAKTSLFDDETVKHKIPRKIIIDNKDVFVNKKPLFKLDDLLNLWRKKFEIPAFIKVDLIHVYIPPSLDMSLVFNQNWLIDLKDHFLSKNEKNVNLAEEKPSVLDGQAYIECDGQTEMVPSKVYRVVKYLKENKIYDAISALKQDEIYKKSGVATTATFPRIIQLWKINNKPHPFLFVLFKTEKNSGRYFLNRNIKIVKT